MAAAQIPGSDIGKTTRSSTRGSDDPSIQAASSRSRGMSSIEFFSIQIMNGMLVTARKAAVAFIDDSQPSLVYIWNSGTTKMLIGSPLRNSVANIIAAVNGTCLREITYAAR